MDNTDLHTEISINTRKSKPEPESEPVDGSRMGCDRLPPFMLRQTHGAASLVNSEAAPTSASRSHSAQQTAQSGRAITFADSPLQTQTQTLEYVSAITAFSLCVLCSLFSIQCLPLPLSRLPYQ